MSHNIYIWHFSIQNIFYGCIFFFQFYSSIHCLLFVVMLHSSILLLYKIQNESKWFWVGMSLWMKLKRVLKQRRFDVGRHSILFFVNVFQFLFFRHKDNKKHWTKRISNKNIKELRIISRDTHNFRGQKILLFWFL